MAKQERCQGSSRKRSACLWHAVLVRKWPDVVRRASFPAGAPPPVTEDATATKDAGDATHCVGRAQAVRRRQSPTRRAPSRSPRGTSHVHWESPERLTAGPGSPTTLKRRERFRNSSAPASPRGWASRPTRPTSLTPGNRLTSECANSADGEVPAEALRRAWELQLLGTQIASHIRASLPKYEALLGGSAGCSGT